MEKIHSRKMVAAAAGAALLLGLAGGAWAQQDDTTGGTTGGTTADDTSAGNTNGGGMPQIQHQGNVAYVSGGVGQDESRALQRAGHQWPLALRFTGPGSDFLADVQVRIVGAGGHEVLQARSRGPYMLVRLRPGRYTVHASYKGEEKTQAVSVGGKGSAHAAFAWSTQ